MQKTLILTFLCSSVVLSQTTVNPDISVLGDLIMESDGGEIALSNSGIELALQGYVNPFARADVFVHKHDGEIPIELEEAFLSIERGLPFNLGLRMGKFRPSFGKINREHFHTYYYILPSRPVQSVFGEEMWSGTGLELNLLVPFPWYSQITAGYFRQGIFPHHHQENGQDHDHGEEEEVGPVATARFSSFFDVTMITHLEVGVSHYHETTGKKEMITAGDLKLRWRPDAYRSFTWQGDVFFKGAGERAAYTWVNYQFNRAWNLGLILDYSSSLEDEKYASLGVFFGFSPVEESSVFRVRILREYHGNEKPHLSVVTQAIWSLGPHKPHRY